MASAPQDFLPSLDFDPTVSSSRQRSGHAKQYHQQFRPRPGPHNNLMTWSRISQHRRFNFLARPPCHETPQSQPDDSSPERVYRFLLFTREVAPMSGRNHYSAQWPFLGLHRIEIRTTDIASRCIFEASSYGKSPPIAVSFSWGWKLVAVWIPRNSRCEARLRNSRSDFRHVTTWAFFYLLSDGKRLGWFVVLHHA